MKTIGMVLLLVAAAYIGRSALADEPNSHAAHGSGEATLTPDASLKMLQDGNARFVSGALQHPHQDAARRGDVASGQRPFAVILACADSRVAPEVVFDEGLGDLFVIRVAGNIADDAVLGSIEYAVEHLGSPLVVVMGHERCGAVTAAVDAVKTGAPPPGHLSALVDPIRPAVTSQKPGEDLLDRAIVANVAEQVAKVSADEELAAAIKSGKLKVVGGRYDLDTGEFKLTESKPASAAPDAGSSK